MGGVFLLFLETSHFRTLSSHFLLIYLYPALVPCLPLLSPFPLPSPPIISVTQTPPPSFHHIHLNPPGSLSFFPLLFFSFSHYFLFFSGRLLGFSFFSICPFYPSLPFYISLSIFYYFFTSTQQTLSPHPQRASRRA
ncbi:hypothetical protein HOY82DRAFT_371818 [Tuber indicum]|nr:hypothetical protein HOY82DRAFT_371818 [Tuber indicum]